MTAPGGATPPAAGTINSEARGGLRPLRCLLIANRGEIARRVIRTARAMGLRTVAVYSEADAQALHVREADEAVALGGLASADSYLRIDKLLHAAQASGADAVHPGYGFLSENADFAQAVQDAGLTWVGPAPQAIRLLGNKSRAKQLATDCGVPCLPGYQGSQQDEAHLLAQGHHLGVPLMVKAVAGGGGRGMRLVTALTDLPAALRAARSEATAAFGCGDVLLERALLAPRHVEVQVLADQHGGLIHLGERDCSVQRRHQKLIEETPSPAVGPALREQLGRSALALARAAGYSGVGTVEFLLEGDAFYLMEMNTRLQVEHTVTEAVTGLDLVEWQLRVARGEPLALRQDQVVLQGHAIQARLCAEDERWVPHSGTVLHWRSPGSDAVRIDHAIAPGQVVPPWYDAMLGKVVVHAATRQEALQALAAALDRTQLLGLPTNRMLLAAVLRHPVFAAGAAGVAFLGQAHADLLNDIQKQELTIVDRIAVGAILMSNSSAPGTHWRPSLAGTTALMHRFVWPVRVMHRDTPRSIRLMGQPGGGWQPVDAQGDRSLVAETLRIEPLGGGEEGGRNGVNAPPPHKGGLVSGRLVWGARSQAMVAVQVADGRWHGQCGAIDVWWRDVSHAPVRVAGATAGATELRAPFNGRVLAVQVAAGQRITRGEALVVIESMKLEHVLSASSDGMAVTLSVSPGQQVSSGQILMTFEPPAQ